jgi:hypothetical protein
MLNKFQQNFGVRSLVGCEMEGLVEKYFESLFTFTISAYRTTLSNKPSTITELMAHTNSIWSRFVFETIQLKSELQEKVEGFILEIITV